MEKERTLKKQIIKSAESVKKKLKMMRDITSNNENALESFLKPITEPLKQIAYKTSPTPTNATDTDKVSPQRETKNKNKRLSRTPLKLNKIKKRRSFDQYNDALYYPDNESDSDSDHQNEMSEPQSETKQYLDLNINTSGTSFKTPEYSTDEVSSNKSWSMSTEKITNIPFGVRQERGKLLLGTAHISVTENDISVGEQKYVKTPGLIELLFKKSPDLSIISTHDLQHYKTMLINTNAHRRDFDSKKPIKSNKGRKYMQIIKPLFMKSGKNCESTESCSHGGGLPVKKIVSQNVDYVYWDDPNELVNRLKLLWASRNAGNTGLDNEIISIIEELRESGIID